MAVAVPSGFMEKLIADLNSPALEEFRLKFGVSGEMKRLKDTLASINSMMLDAEKRQEKEPALRDWLRKLKDVLYDAEDLLDEFQFKMLSSRVDRDSKVRRFFSTSSRFLFRWKMLEKIVSIEERLDLVAAGMPKFALEAIDVDKRVPHRSRETTSSSSFAYEDVIGRDLDKELIIDLLMQQNPEDDDGRFSVIPIVGMGGLGKTTLARTVFHDERVTEAFPLKSWVCVSEDFNIKQLMVKIINSASNFAHAHRLNLEELEIEQLRYLLSNTLSSQKFLLVLDDVWNEDRVKWIELRDLIQASSKGGKILLTTRGERVASMMGTAPPYYLQPLSHEESWSLFVECAFRNRQQEKHPEFEDIGRQIVEKCKGLPLAVRTLGSLLFSKCTRHEWMHVLESLRNNDIWNSKGILPVLKLSYDQMPTYLKQCFAMFSLYPHDYVFLSSDVASLWGALGLLLPPAVGETFLDVSNQYLSELSSRSLIQYVEDYGTFFCFQIHDLVHDLAVFVAGDECLLVGSQDQVISGNIRHLSFIEDDLKYFTQQKFGMRTILFPVHGVGAKNEVWLNEWISSYKSLRFLDLSDSTYVTLPQSIAKLKHLRFLSLRNNTKIKRLPDSVCELLNLQSLLLDGCTRLEILPKELRKLINLRQLGITTKQPVLPESDIENLMSLEYLCIKKCEKLESLFVERKLPSLQTLEVEICDRLRYLPLDVNHFPKLETLVINKCADLQFSHEWLSTLSLLKSLQIIGCPNFKPLPSDLNLPALKSFKNSDGPGLLSTDQFKM
ncbi:hypothetical protein PIB30_079997 [Stylosanthes scabra]|uniref:Disease resistance protein RGA3 n=1 Tax=Stylosanthes scabra TaxID=79078 RepID=A0ABU6YQD3_9FABA|nr:hypothetical protein [Stylosanthes scabra]